MSNIYIVKIDKFYYDDIHNALGTDILKGFTNIESAKKYRDDVVNRILNEDYIDDKMLDLEDEGPYRLYEHDLPWNEPLYGTICLCGSMDCVDLYLEIEEIELDE